MNSMIYFSQKLRKFTSLFCTFSSFYGLLNYAEEKSTNISVVPFLKLFHHLELISDKKYKDIKKHFFYIHGGGLTLKNPPNAMALCNVHASRRDQTLKRVNGIVSGIWPLSLSNVKKPTIDIKN